MQKVRDISGIIPEGTWIIDHQDIRQTTAHQTSNTFRPTALLADWEHIIIHGGPLLCSGDLVTYIKDNTKRQPGRAGVVSRHPESARRDVADIDTIDRPKTVLRKVRMSEIRPMLPQDIGAISPPPEPQAGDIVRWTDCNIYRLSDEVKNGERSMNLTLCYEQENGFHVGSKLSWSMPWNYVTKKRNCPILGVLSTADRKVELAIQDPYFRTEGDRSSSNLPANIGLDFRIAQIIKPEFTFSHNDVIGVDGIPVNWKTRKSTPTPYSNDNPNADWWSENIRSAERLRREACNRSPML